MNTEAFISGYIGKEAARGDQFIKALAKSHPNLAQNLMEKITLSRTGQGRTLPRTGVEGTLSEVARAVVQKRPRRYSKLRRMSSEIDGMAQFLRDVRKGKKPKMSPDVDLYG
jgi:hypothetical protein